MIAGKINATFYHKWSTQESRYIEWMWKGFYIVGFGILEVEIWCWKLKNRGTGWQRDSDILCLLDWIIFSYEWRWFIVMNKSTAISCSVIHYMELFQSYQGACDKKKQKNRTVKRYPFFDKLQKGKAIARRKAAACVANCE